MTLPAHVHIAMPSRSGKVETDTAQRLVELATVLGQQGSRFTWTSLKGHSLIDVARSILTHGALGTPCTHVLWLDDDIIPEVPALLALLMSGHAIAGIPCSMRKLDLQRVVDLAGEDPAYWREHTSELLSAACDRNFAYPTGSAGVEIVRGFAPVDHVGTGCLLVAREVLEAVAAHAPEVKHPESPGEMMRMTFACWTTDDGLRIGEDVHFCRAARALGYQPHILTGTLTKHVGSFEFPCIVTPELERRRAQADGVRTCFGKGAA